MSELDSKIDSMLREKLISLIQENSVRIGKINIRYTKSNQKNSLERMDAIYSSYERLLRSIPREMVKIEKSVRIKFQTPLSQERKTRFSGFINDEMETLIGQIIRNYEKLWNQLGHGDEFEKRIHQTREKVARDIEQNIFKLAESLDKEISSVRRISPKELEEMYNLGQEVLFQLNLVGVLQDLHLILDDLKSRGLPQPVFEDVQEGIRECVQIGKKIEREIPPSHNVNARKEWKMRVAKESMDLKEVIHSLHTFAQSLQIPREKRNEEVIQKTWNRIETALAGKPESEAVTARLNPFYQLTLS